MRVDADARRLELAGWDEEPDRTIDRVLADVWDRRLSRRQLLALGTWGALAILLSSCTEAAIQSLLNQIANRPVRRNLSAMAANDPIVVAYTSAVQQMVALDASDPANPLAWTNQARIHLNHCPHGNWLFLPWHRAYLFYFEKICRKLSGMADFALPYWNWSLNPRMPAVLCAGGPLENATRLPRACTDDVDPNVFAPAALEPIQVEPSFLVYGSGQIGAADPQRQFAGFGPLEGGPHNTLHGFVGGDMGGFMSPLDPVFWTHHNMIEACWIDWNIRRGHPNSNDAAWTQRTFTDFYDENGAPVSVTVFQGLLYPLLSYRFDIPPIGTT